MERQIGHGRSTASGQTRIQSGFIHFAPDGPRIELKHDQSWRYLNTGGVRYARADCTRNLILLKRRCFENVRWNEQLRFMGEHLDFYLSLRRGGLKGAFTPDSIHLHRDDLKRFCIDMDAEKSWRGRDTEERRQMQKTFVETWGKVPEVISAQVWQDRVLMNARRAARWDFVKARGVR